MLNDDAPWDDFDPRAYVDQNYRDLLDADAEILTFVREHFSNHFREHPDRLIRGIDIGAGANLYPALSMLPWCTEITLLERARKNVRYLRGQKPHYDVSWDSFWEVLCQDPEYAVIDADRRERFRARVQVEQGNLFAMERRKLFGRSRDPRRWQIGTMFFVAESISTSHAEFRRGVACFMEALEPGAPFAAAFMEGSRGYDVGDRHYPACDVDETQVRESFQGFVEKIETRRLGESSHLVRPGHTGIILACGRRDRNS
ncbi:SCO2525 family SAM-dependent methyltransferase [Streptomyces pseudovenezuelae]|uniref:SCO2525 family SAM-dependent methyltransferase n=1 Tax=Streptomyces pseudovenezuelae TaxID=67350 RepID=UPI002476163E|nr:SCO2525 family SAM-dependent methyltransferase [Streptomyces pseudovenezuelae]